MKKILLFLICIFISIRLLSQDLIITNYGDSIICKITLVSSENIHFIWKQNNEYSSSSFPRSIIKAYKYNFSPESIIPKEETIKKREFESFQISVDGGFSYELARNPESIPDDLIAYYKDLKSGFNIGTSFTYNLFETFGIGIKYKCFMSSNYLDNAYLMSSSGTMKYGILSDNLRVSFYGPSFSYRTLKGHHKSIFYSDYYAGYIRYRNDAIVLNPAMITGNTIGYGMDTGCDIELSENFLLGFQASFFAGGIRKFRVDDGVNVKTVNLEKGSYESLYRIDFSIGLRLKL